MHFYSEADSFPAQISLIDDSDPPNAANFGAAHEGNADRTAYLARRLLPSGKSAFFTGVSVPSDLTAITGMTNNDTRLVVGVGLFVYKSTASNTSDNIYTVDGNGGTGRWKLVDYSTLGRRLVHSQTVTYFDAPVDISGTSGTCSDPARRASGTTRGYQILGSTAMTVITSDMFVVSWAVPFMCFATGNMLDTADACFGAGFSASGIGTLTYPDPWLDDSASVDADIILTGRSGGQPYSAISTVTSARYNLSRSATLFPCGVSGSLKLSLVGACNSHSISMQPLVLQGAMMSIQQYRVII